MKVNIWAKLFAKCLPTEDNTEETPLRLAVTDVESDIAIIDYSGPKITTGQLFDLLPKSLNSPEDEAFAEFQKNLLDRNEARLANIEIDDDIISKLANQCA